ncbi:MAG: Xaa-Pro peptidase family protein [Bauldia sp.]
MTADAAAARKAGDVPVTPFDAAKLDRLLEEEGIDAVVVSSKPNIQYLLGGYRFFFFDHFDAIGPSRYLPLLVYMKGHAERSAYIGNPMEAYERDLGRFWVPKIEPRSRGSVDAMRIAVEHLKSLGRIRRIGVERAFLPADAEAALREGMAGAEIVEAWSPLERLRAVKTPAELALIREASERVVDAMLAVMSAHGPGATKRELVQALRREEVGRGLVFEYCLITAGTSLNRAPSDQRWNAGEILSIDSGGNYGGYIGDLCRMAIHGEPDAELSDMLSEVDAIQQAARKPIRHGATGAEVYAVAGEVHRRSPNANSIEFVAHGMGLVSHESPRLTYSRQDMDKPLEAGMVLSIETTLAHRQRGFIKLEDTVAVTGEGWQAFGDSGRGWNRGGAG